MVPEPEEIVDIAEYTSWLHSYNHGLLPEDNFFEFIYDVAPTLNLSHNPIAFEYWRRKYGSLCGGTSNA